MIIRRISPVTGKENAREINVTQEQIDRWQTGALIQNVMPELSASDREFLISGCTDEDWKTLYGGPVTVIHTDLGPLRDKTYIGDGVYAEIDDYQIWISTEDGAHRIALEPAAFASLLHYAKRFPQYKGMIK